MNNSNCLIWLLVTIFIWGSGIAYAQNDITKTLSGNSSMSVPVMEKSKQKGSGYGVRMGIGTDISLSLGFGAGAFYIMAPSSGGINWDLGLDIYYANVSEEDRDAEGTEYDETTEVLVFGLRSNALFGYHPEKTSVYFAAGAGFVVSYVDWREVITYSYPYAPHSETWSDDGIALGNVLNLGIGMTFGGGLEARFETPLLLFYDTPGNGGGSASSIVPTFTLNLLYRFP